jgi:sulfate adenylyltransferase subunit 1 (EFTu-like GTPase family)
MLQFQKRIDERSLYQLNNQIASTTKLLLKFSTLLVIESLRSNSKIYNFILYDNSNNTTISYGPNYTPLMLSGRQQQQQSF